MTRHYPENYSDLKKAFFNFIEVAKDFTECFNKYVEIYPQNNHFDSEQLLETQKFGETETVSKFRDHYIFDSIIVIESKETFHRFLIRDLVLEMTRALNYIYEIARIHIDPQFGFENGIITVNSNDIKDVRTFSSQFLYKESEKITLYPNLEKFMDIRVSRNYSFGEGIVLDYRDDLPF